MRDAIKILKEYVEYTTELKKARNSCMGYIWNSQKIQAFLDKADQRKVSKVANAFLNYFLSLDRIESKEIQVEPLSGTRLLRIATAINSKTEEIRKKRFQKIWEAYRKEDHWTGREREVRIQLSNILKDDTILVILDYVNGWDSKLLPDRDKYLKPLKIKQISEKLKINKN